MAGQGDINRPDAWQTGGTPLTPGSTSTPPAQGDLTSDGGDPDLFLGSFTLQLVAPSLGVSALPARVGQGQPESPKTWNAVSPTLTTQATTAPGGQGDLENPKAFTATGPTLGLGSIAAPTEHGDIGEVYGSDSGPIEQLVWQAGTPALVTQPTTTPTGLGDIPDPWAWQDAVFYLTSWPYPLLVTEHFLSAGGVSAPPQFQDLDHFVGSALLTAGTLHGSLVIYSNWPPENIQSSGLLTGGTLAGVLVTYSNWPPENIQSSGLITAGTLVFALITYTNWPAENIQSSGLLTGGTLT